MDPHHGHQTRGIIYGVDAGYRLHLFDEYGPRPHLLLIKGRDAPSHREDPEMSHRSITLTAALTMTVAALLPAAASEATLDTAAHGAFSVPAVLGAAYHTPGLALSAADVRAQGGLLVPALTRWQEARPATASAEPFKAPATITVA
jgi:hypothetical protein